jgi:hypothetical protein
MSTRVSAWAVYDVFETRDAGTTASPSRVRTQRRSLFQQPRTGLQDPIGRAYRFSPKGWLVCLLPERAESERLNGKLDHAALVLPHLTWNDPAREPGFDASAPNRLHQ